LQEGEKSCVSRRRIAQQKKTSSEKEGSASIERKGIAGYGGEENETLVQKERNQFFVLLLREVGGGGVMAVGRSRLRSFRGKKGHDKCRKEFV